MSAKKSRQPYALAFTLGEGANLKSLANAFCYFCRQEDRNKTKALFEIPEPAISDRDAESMFEAIDQLIDEHAVWVELNADAEDRDQSNRGFHAGTTFEDGVSALVRGGFRVVDLHRQANQVRPRSMQPYPLSRNGVEGDVEDACAAVARHVDLASLTSVVEGAKTNHPTFGWHAESAAQLAIEMLSSSNAKGFIDRVAKLVEGWSSDSTDILILAVAHGCRLRARKVPDSEASALDEKLRSLLAALPQARDPRVTTILVKWKLAKSASPSRKATKPRLYLQTGAQSQMYELLPGLNGALANAFSISRWPSKGSAAAADAKLAEELAAALGGFLLSSDTDFPYVACMIEADDDFVENLDAETDNHVVLRKVSRKDADSLVKFLANTESIDAKDDRVIRRAVKILEQAAPVEGVHIVAGMATGIFVVAKGASGRRFGVFAPRIDT